MTNGTKAEARFGATLNATNVNQIKKLSPSERKARGILKALADARLAQERAEAAAKAHQEQAEAYAAQAADLVAALEAIPEEEAESE